MLAYDVEYCDLYLNNLSRAKFSAAKYFVEKYFDIEKIFNDNIDKFYHKKYDIYLSAIKDDEGE